MAYLAPINAPSSVRHAIKLNFLAPEAQNIVVAKANRLEVYDHTKVGLVLQYSKTVYGRIIMLNKLRPASASTDHLFVGTDRYMYFTLSWDSSTNSFRTERSYMDLADKSARDAQTGDRSHIDPSGSYMTLELFEGVLTVIPIIKPGKKQTSTEIGNLGEPLPVRIPEMFVRASTFYRNRLEGRKEQPKIALLYEDNYKKVKLKLRQIAYSPGLSGDGPNAEFEQVSGGFDGDLEVGASHLIPIAAPAHGLIILGETSITYWETSLRRPMQQSLQEATIWVAWEQIDAQRYLFADEYGKLYLFMLEIDHREEVIGWKLDVLGETSKAAVLVYLGQGQVFVGSHQGDSQVITIQPKSLRVTQTLTNIAPILDFTIMDLGNRSGEGQANEFSSGQARLVTGCGAFKDGSLRTVRSGVGLEELGVLGEMKNITNLFALKSEQDVQFADLLLVSFVDETRIFRFSADGEAEELDRLSGLKTDAGTLYAGNIPGGKLVQVTQFSVQLMDADSGMISGDWSPDKGQSLTAVSTNDESIIIAVGGSNLVALDLRQDLATIAERSFDSEAQIACVSHVAGNSALCVAGFWNSSEISVLSIKDLQTLQSTNAAVDSISVPRSLLVANIFKDQAPTLFIAMADGNVVTYSISAMTGAMTNKNSIVLGTRQAEFRRLTRADGLDNVFATCSQPSLIYGSEGRLVYSAITAEDATVVCAFNAAQYPGAIAMATNAELKIALIDEERSTHTQGVHFGETVRRIAYSPALKAFGLGTISRSLEDGAEIVQSRFKLADEMSFYVQAVYELEDDELVESVMRCELPTGSGDVEERFVVGTAFVDDENTDSVRGRIIVFEVTEDRQLKVVTEESVRGACRCLGMVEGRIVAALVKTVVTYALLHSRPDAHPTLHKTASYRTSTAPISVSILPKTSTRPATIAIADLMKSLSLITFTPSRTPLADLLSTHQHSTISKSDTLAEVARHNQITWSTATTPISDHEHLLADAEGNLTLLSHDSSPDTLEQDRRRLTPTAEIRLGELVNKMQPLPIPPSNAVISPKAFLATVDGGVYLFGVIAQEWQDRLMRLQSALVARIKSLGNVPFGIYRGFKNQVRDEGDEGPFRFVDGEVLEGCLGLDGRVLAEVATEAGWIGREDTGESTGKVVEELRGVVESLRRLR